MLYLITCLSKLASTKVSMSISSNDESSEAPAKMKLTLQFVNYFGLDINFGKNVLIRF